MNAKFATRCTALAAVVFVLSTGGTAFGDEMSAAVTVLRGTPPQVHQQQQTPQQQTPQQQTPQRIELAPLRPSCAEGYAYSLLGGYCYRLRNPLGDDW